MATDHDESLSLAGGRNPWLIAVVVSIATFMEVLDTTIANVSLRHIAGSLATSLDESTWIADQLPGLQRHRAADQRLAGQRHRPQALLHGCVAVFTGQSPCCAARCATSLGMIFFRACCKASAAAGWRPASNRSSPTPSRPRSAAMAFALYGVAVVVGSGHRADARRLDHRQLHLALVFLINCRSDCCR